MSGWLIALTGCVYAYVSIEQFYKGNFGLGNSLCWIFLLLIVVYIY
jgi:hypothetical protein